MTAFDSLLFAAAVLVVVIVGVSRPRPRRVRPMTRDPSPVPMPSRSRGRVLRLLVPAALVLVLGVGAHPLLAVIVGAAAFAWPSIRQRSIIRRARALRREEYPEVVDLLRVAVSGGANLPLAFRAVADRAPPSWRLPMARSAGGLARGQPVDEALTPMRAECPEADVLCAALGAAAESGTPLLPTLSRLADEARAAHRRAGEAAARRLPVVLLFPLIGCALPAFVLLTVVPLLAGGLRSLRL